MHWPGTNETVFFCCYLLVGPLAWLLYTYGVFAGVTKLRLLDKERWKPNPPPLASILIPAKDEEARMRACLQSALDQDYPNFELIAIDDRSTDRTGAIMDEMAAADPRLKVLHIQPGSLGPGWTGKNNALFQGTKIASGKWLLFVDSDVLLQKNALSKCLSTSIYKKYDLFSLLPGLEAHKMSERVLIPLCSMVATAMYLGLFINSDKRAKSAFANGQFLMTTREAYDGIGGHETVKDRMCEDTEIARLMMGQGRRVRVAIGNELCAVRMYDGYKNIVKGWSRIYYAARVGKFRHIVGAMIGLLIMGFPVYPALVYGIVRLLHPHGNLLDDGWMTAAAIHFSLLTLCLGYQYRLSQNSWLNAFLFPISGPITFYILYKGLMMCITKKVEWRGTSYTHKMAENLAVK